MEGNGIACCTIPGPIEDVTGWLGAIGAIELEYWYPP